MIKIGTMIKCNDKRYGWTVPVLSIVGPWDQGDHAFAVIRPRVGGRLVKVSLNRIYIDGKARAQGYNVVDREPAVVEEDRMADDGGPAPHSSDTVVEAVS